MTDQGEAFLRLEGITKTFPGGVVANDSIDLAVRQNEIHGLLGENGAGKSTLMKILYGLYTKDSGTITFKDVEREFDSPEDAIDAGIGMVHQHFKLIPKFSVVDNVILGERKARLQGGGSDRNGSRLKRVVQKVGELATIDRTGPKREIQELIDRYGIEVDIDAKVWELDVGEQQRVEILKALYRDVDLLILDEPTAALTPTQAERLFDTLQEMVEDHLTIIFITHKLDEAREIADRITILRDGSVIDTVDTATVTNPELARKMVGRDVLLNIQREVVRIGEEVLTAKQIRTVDDRGVEMLKGIDLTISEGEIVGVAGVSGNGQRELAECLVGLRELTGGTLEIRGEDYTNRPPRDFIDAGVSYIPEDRMRVGCATDLDVVKNAVIKDLGLFRNGLLLDEGAMRKRTEDIVDEFDVRLPNVDVSVGKLSGGNIQKLILARELSRQPNVLIANQPTRGVDVGAIEFIRETLLSQRENDTGILLISEELDEVLQMSDRIVVMYEGEIVYETANEDVDKDRISRFMTEGSAPTVAEGTR